MEPIVESLTSLPRSERRAALESIVVAEFREVLLMTEDEDLPLTESYFDQGLTSLLLMNVKERLEGLLGCGIDSTVLFNSPTVERLVEYLHDELFETARAVAAAAAEKDALWDDVLRSLYQS